MKYYVFKYTGDKEKVSPNWTQTQAKAASLIYIIFFSESPMVYCYCCCLAMVDLCGIVLYVDSHNAMYQYVIGEELRVLLNLMFLGFITMNWIRMSFMWSSFTLFMYHILSSVDLALLHTVMCMNSVGNMVRLDLE